MMTEEDNSGGAYHHDSVLLLIIVIRKSKVLNFQKVQLRFQKKVHNKRDAVRVHFVLR